MSRRLLIIAFEFPPSNGASVQRIMSVYNHFSESGWKVDVLTAHPSAYEKIDQSAVPPENKTGKTMRVFAVDVMRHLSIRGKYIGSLLRPDRWGMTWAPLSKLRGLIHVKKYKPDVIWSSSPIPSVHDIAHFLKIKTGALWVADYRDPMSHLQGGGTKVTTPLLADIDSKTVSSADIMTFATDEIKGLYQGAFKEQCTPDKCYTIKNGYVESIFRQFNEQQEHQNKKSVHLYYAGVLYDHGRDPRPLFMAISKLSSSLNITLTFQGAGDGLKYSSLLDALNIRQFVHFKPSIGFAQAIENMYESDIMVLIQGERFHNQIPGKLYEYLRTYKPVLIISPAGSATQKEAGNHPGVYCSEDDSEIALAIQSIANSSVKNHYRDMTTCSREYQAKRLEEIIVMKINSKKAQ